jgi:hypothetical protein
VNRVVVTSESQTAVFEISGAAGPPVKVGLSVSPATAPANINRVATITFQDDFGNAATTATNSFSLGFPAGVVAPLGYTRTNGVVEYPLSATTAGTYTITATSPGLRSPNPVTITVTPAAPSKLLLSANPATLDVRGTTTLTITVTDAFNNAVSSGIPLVSLSANPAFSATFGSVSAFTNGAQLDFINATGPIRLGADASGNIYIPDTSNKRIRRVSPEGVITTVAGPGPSGTGVFVESGDGGPATAASILPQGVVVGANGILYIASTRIRCL